MDASATASITAPRSLTFRPVHTGPAEIAAPLTSYAYAPDDEYFADGEGRGMPLGVHLYSGSEGEVRALTGEGVSETP
jgi:hypothetical protein